MTNRYHGCGFFIKIQFSEIKREGRENKRKKAKKDQSLETFAI